MKMKLLTIIALVLAGVLVFFMVVSERADVQSQYETYLAKARANAEKQIPYNACNNYKKAFAIQCEDEAIYLEYLEQCRLLGKEFHVAAIEQYVEYFPGSAAAYEMLCELQYERGEYKKVIATALQAREGNIATERVRDLYNECSYMLRTIKSGLEEAQSFLGGYALVKQNGFYGYISQDGYYILANVYPEASTIMAGSAAVNDGEEWHIINSAGFKIARNSEPVDYMGIMIGGKMPIAQNGKYAYVDAGLVIPEELPYDYASNFKYGVAAVRKGDKWALVNTEEQPLTAFVFDDVVLDEFNTCSTNNVIFVKKDGKYMMADTTGNKISEQAFDDVKPFAGSGPAAACLNGKWGFIDNTGAWVIEPQYDGAASFNVGLGGVQIDGKWGYINSSGTLRIACQFDDCKPFSDDGTAAVKEGEYWKYVRLLPYC